MVDAIFTVIENDVQRNELSDFYRENKDRLYRIAFSKLHNRHDSEDAVMEAFARIADKPHNFFAVPPKERTAYVSVIVRNISSEMFARKNAKHMENIEDYEDEIATKIPENVFFDNNRARELIDIIRSLPDSKKDVMILRIVHDKSSAEIARILDIPESTVRKRLSDARKLIRKFMEEHDV
ncbi:MAG: sigma-70 family RNA polymerase sigma factor [Oscillospiraceae bacterium]|nr:sigma-70 family RNA polymerase sigma factor [Oscillospiraceae bacterium]